MSFLANMNFYNSHLGMTECLLGTLSPSIFYWRAAVGKGGARGAAAFPFSPLAPPMGTTDHANAKQHGNCKCKLYYTGLAKKGSCKLFFIIFAKHRLIFKILSLARRWKIFQRSDYRTSYTTTFRSLRFWPTLYIIQSNFFDIASLVGGAL